MRGMSNRCKAGEEHEKGRDDDEAQVRNGTVGHRKVERAKMGEKW